MSILDEIDRLPQPAGGNSGSGVVTIPGDDGAVPAASPNPIHNDFRIIAVAGPLWPVDEQDIAFEPASSRDERQAAVEMFVWSDLVDARIAKRSGVTTNIDEI